MMIFIEEKNVRGFDMVQAVAIAHGKEIVTMVRWSEYGSIKAVIDHLHKTNQYEDYEIVKLGAK